MNRTDSIIIARLTALLPLAIFTGLCSRVPAAVGGGAIFFSWDWIPGIGVNLDVAVDGLSVLFGLIITGTGVFVVLFSADYMAGHRYYVRFFAFLHLFLLSMLGLVLADNLITLFVFWELTTVLSYLLIGFDNKNESARSHARQALLVTGAGGLVLLIGFLMIGGIVDTYRISALAEQARLLQRQTNYLFIMAMVLIGAFTKSAQFPFHFWLPNAMAAPTPISAFLHSATMVKAGIYLLARFHPVLGGTEAWMGTLVVVGGVTALLGAVLAVGQSDLKRMLAYTTIMALGILVMFLGGKTTPALTATVTFLLVHSLYKSALFLVVGIIDHETGTRQVEHIGGLIRTMPMTTFGAATAAMSMAGFPLFLGFIGKEIMYAGALTEDMFPAFATTAAVLSNALMAAVAGIIAIRPFLGPPRQTPRAPHEAPIGMWLGPATIGTLGLIFGIFPDWVGRWLIQPAVSAFHPTVEPVQLKLFHGFNEPLLLSFLTMGLGLGLYLVRRPIRGWLADRMARLPVTGDRFYEMGMAATARTAAGLTRFIQNGSLHRYLLTIIGVFTLATAGIWALNATARPGLLHLPSLPLAQWLLVTLMAAALGVVVVARSRVLAVCALGVIGSGAALIFLVYGAPDLALTQLLVETLTLIIVAIVLLRLPSLDKTAGLHLPGRWFDALVAVGAGTLVAALTLAVTGGPLDRQLTDFFEQNSAIAAHGRNIVNVILVDFRSLDTLGEIVVVATAGLAGFSLLARRRR
ncbi:hydrogen gas-evolving membrane-bound hydrogenase subunit E [uncultured Desulfosarcina sp.]|uniref:hydrogen gas-evolving membrane-bound hydrogenase subunit E n=1 Tax=uncultured Desulfosarcina sp. TaxID=218289 RepID=UPI0029C7257C|nr:hydrogen gas-evolving membrane-bound hydrogenase subunit E [uncultured Desulfosarcina sp.]